MKLLRLIVFACTAAVSACYYGPPLQPHHMDWKGLLDDLDAQRQLPKH